MAFCNTFKNEKSIENLHSYDISRKSFTNGKYGTNVSVFIINL